MTTGYVLHIVGPVDGTVTPYDHTYVVEYDPMRWDGVDPAGNRNLIHLTVCSDPMDARCFADIEAALAYWRQPCGVRPDGKPDMPLTGFTISIVPVKK